MVIIYQGDRVVRLVTEWLDLVVQYWTVTPVVTTRNYLIRATNISTGSCKSDVTSVLMCGSYVSLVLTCLDFHINWVAIYCSYVWYVCIRDFEDSHEAIDVTIKLGACRAGTIAGYDPSALSCWWVSARKTELQCVSNGVMPFLHQPIDVGKSLLLSWRMGICRSLPVPDQVAVTWP